MSFDECRNTKLSPINYFQLIDKSCAIKLNTMHFYFDLQLHNSLPEVTAINK